MYIYKNNTDKSVAKLKLAQWYNQVENQGFKSFNTISRTIQIYYDNILNYFDNTSTNAAAEYLNAKSKNSEKNLEATAI